MWDWARGKSGQLDLSEEREACSSRRYADWTGPWEVGRVSLRPRVEAIHLGGEVHLEERRDDEVENSRCFDCCGYYKETVDEVSAADPRKRRL